VTQTAANVIDDNNTFQPIAASESRLTTESVGTCESFFLRSNRISNRIGRPIRFQIEFSNRISRIYQRIFNPFYWYLLANVNSSSCSLYVVVRPSVCLSFVCNVRAIEIFGNISTPQGILASIDIQVKFYEDRPRGTPTSGELNRRGVAEYSDFRPIDGYISETLQDRR